MPGAECKLSIAYLKMFRHFPVTDKQSLPYRHRRAFQVYNRQLVR